MSYLLRIEAVLRIRGSPQFNTSVQHKRATAFQPPKSLSSTPKKVWSLCWTESFPYSNLTLNWIRGLKLGVPHNFLLTPMLAESDIAYTGGWSLQRLLTINQLFSDLFLNSWPRMTLNKLDKNFFLNLRKKIHLSYKNESYSLKLYDHSECTFNESSQFLHLWCLTKTIIV